MGVAARSTQAPEKGERSAPDRGDSRPRKALTIGAVCKILSQEFEDISISKIRYLEDQRLLSPRRAPGAGGVGPASLRGARASPCGRSSRAGPFSRPPASSRGRGSGWVSTPALTARDR